MKRFGALVSVFIAVVGLVACGDDDAPKGPQPLSRVQSERLAQAGYMNLQARGARFEANSAFLGVGDGESLTLVGEIDWANHAGRAVVRGEGAEAGVAEVYWQDTIVLERRPAMDSLIASRGGPAAAWIARAPDKSQRQLDRLLAIILGLAMEQPDNAVLIQQGEDNAFIRTDELRGTAVEVLRYGNRNLYWLDANDGTMLRFEGNSVAGNAPTIVDFISHQEVTIPRPTEADDVPFDSVAEIYGAFVGG